MPRTTPRFDTEMLACRRSSDRPTAVSSSSNRYHSRNVPRESSKCTGLISNAPATSNGRICTCFILGRWPLGASSGLHEVAQRVLHAQAETPVVTRPPARENPAETRNPHRRKGRAPHLVRELRVREGASLGADTLECV